jgi:AraC-type DNA-binding domain-containing proteins
MEEVILFLIEYCGYHTHNPDHDIILRPTGTTSYLFLLILSPMTFYFPNQSPEKVRPGACILFTPSFSQHYQAEKEFFNSYIHFFCSQEDIAEFNIKKNIIFYPDNVEELNWIIKKIYQEFINKLSKSDQMIDKYIHQLLILLHRGHLNEEIPFEQRQSIYPELLALRQLMLQTCEEDWTIERMCKTLNLGKSQLYKYYEHFFHSTPKEELILARLEKAKYLMNNDVVTIKQAAFDSGFQNIYHFNRLFKSHCGCTPGEYRRKS